MRLLVKIVEQLLGQTTPLKTFTGFFTKFGDGGADILPLFRLNKRQGAALLAELGADKALYEKYQQLTWKKINYNCRRRSGIGSDLS